MNERLRELALQAKQSALDAMIKIVDKEEALKVYSETYDTKFAELIVQDCLAQVDKVDTMLDDDKEIIEMAIQAGFDEHHAKFDTRIKAFAKLVAEKAIKEALAQEQEQDGECKYCTDGCPACDARCSNSK